MRSLEDATIVFVNNFPGQTLGGHEGRLHHVLRGCVEAGMMVHLICIPGSAMETLGRELGARVAPMNVGRANIIRTRSRIRKYLRRYDADIVQGTGYLTSVLARLAGGPLRTVVVSTASNMPDAPRHSGESASVFAFRQLLERWTARKNDLTIVVSKAIGDALIESGAPRESVVVIRTAVIPDALLRAAKDGPGLPERDRTFRVGLVGRLQRFKGGVEFVRMASLLAAERDDVSFFVVGIGEEMDALRRQVSDAGLDDRLAFLGHVAPAAPVIADLDVMVIPSLSEGLGTVALEAAVLGVPVVASRVGGLVESVNDGVSGVLVPRADIRALADAVSSLLDDPERRARMGEAARAWVADEFSVADMVSDHLALYRRIVSAR